MDVPADAPRIDLSVTTTMLPGAAWTDPSATRTALEAALLEGYGTAGGGAWLPFVLRDTADEVRSVHLGADAFAPSGTVVRAPADSTVADARDRSVVLRSGDVDVLLAGIRPSVPTGAPVAAGDVVGRVIEASGEANPLPAHVHVQLTPAGVGARGAVEPSVATAWRALSPDASALVGVAARDVPTDSGDELLTRRDAVVARVQEHYYAHPPRIERGWRHHLIDTSGRAYLDMVNNVAIVGHSNPRVTAAASRQFGLLNTNSRFCYDGMVTYAERIVELLPEPLDTVFFVNSGSEAVDLALRIVRSVTARKDTICLAGGYHGWSTATDEISTSLNDNPDSRDTRPPWVHLAPLPNLYRGEHRGADAADRYADAVRSIVAQIPGRSGGFRGRTAVRQRRRGRDSTGLPAAGLRVRARRRRARDLRRGAGRVRPHRQRLLGLPDPRRRPRRDHDGQGGGQRSPHRVRRDASRDRRPVLVAGLLLLVRRR